MIYVEILIILIIFVYGWTGFRRGFISQFFDLIGMVISLFLALRFYNFSATILENLGLSANLVKPVGFFVLWIVLQTIFYLLILLILHLIPQSIQSGKVNRFFGIFVGLVKGLVIVSIILMLFFILPFSPAFKDDLIKYPLSGYLIKSTTKIENQVEQIFRGATPTFLNPIAPDETTTNLNFKTDKFNIDEKSEQAMVDLLNSERAKAGLKPLTMDPTIRAVARSHSIDMAKNGYFSHIDLDGKTPADRLTAGGVSFWLAGENIALAPTYELAEIGFMNSPKHRDNILDPKFGRLGIGIIDLGVYGRMITQNFAN